MSESAPKVTGIGGVFLRVRDTAKMAAWYREQLGVGGEDGNADFPWREHENPERVGRTVWSLFPENTDYFGPWKPAFMINYRVSDLDSVLAHLRRNGVTVEKTEDHDYGRFAWITDPEGNRVELWEPIPE